MKIKVFFMALAMTFLAAFATQAQSAGDFDSMMTEMAAEMSKMSAGEEGIEGVIYDKTSRAILFLVTDELSDMCEAAEIPRTDIKRLMIEGISEGGEVSEFVSALSLLEGINVKMGVRYNYKGKRYTDFFSPADFRK